MSRNTPSLRFHLTRAPGSGPGLASYRASLEQMMRPLFVRSAEPFSDAEWCNMFANRLRVWFAMSDDLLVVDSPRFFQLDAFRSLVRELGDLPDV